jgi:hypothetical protein
MTRRERITYRVLLIGVIIWAPTFPTVGVIGSLTHASWTGPAVVGMLAWFFTFWYWEGLRCERHRTGRQP